MLKVEKNARAAQKISVPPPSWAKYPKGGGTKGGESLFKGGGQVEVKGGGNPKFFDQRGGGQLAKGGGKPLSPPLCYTPGWPQSIPQPLPGC